MTVPYSFATATAAIPLSQLDSNFNTAITLGNTAIQLGNTVTTLNNMTLANVTISSGNVTITNVTVTTANVTTVNASTVIAATANVTFANITGENVTTSNVTTLTVTNNPTFSGGTANGVLYLNGSKVATSGSTLVFDGTKLGVGTNSPTYRLDVVQSQNDDTVSAVGNANTGGAASAQFYAGNGTAKAQFFMLGTNYTTSGVFKANVGGVYSSNGAGLAIVAGGASAPIVFAAAGTSESMRLDGTGLGIGVTPSYKLHVKSNIPFAVEAASNDSVLKTYLSSSQWRISATYGTTGAYYPIIFYTSDTNTLTFDTSGNLGLGVTPSYKLDVQGTEARVHDSSGVNYVSLNIYGGVVLGGNGAGTRGISTVSTDALTFGTNNTERARIDSSGNLLVGTTSQVNSGKLCVTGTLGTISANVSGREINFDYNGANYIFANGGTSATITVISNTNGVVLSNGATSWASASDERVKTDLKPIEDAANKVATLRAVTGRYKTDDVSVSRAFLIAQDVQKVLPEAVNSSNPDELLLAYTETIPLLVAAIKELTARVAQLETKGA